MPLPDAGLRVSSSSIVGGIDWSDNPNQSGVAIVRDRGPDPFMDYDKDR